MPVDRPYRRTCRQFVDGEYAEGGRAGYIQHPKFAESPAQYVRAFLILLKDLRELFDYIEPSDNNLGCYSFRIHALLLRACVEVEANCKAILKENGYAKKEYWNMEDYKKIDCTHFLSSYAAVVPNWQGTRSTRSPLMPWAADRTLPWYDAYNKAKHDRHSEFEQATFEHLVDAVSAVFLLLSAQFGTEDFSSAPVRLVAEGPDDGTESGIGEYFRVRFPDNLPIELRYDFDWQRLKDEPDPFRSIDYSAFR